MAFSTIEDRPIVEAAIKRAMTLAGPGWGLLGVALQEALVCREICSAILANEKQPGFNGAAAMIQGAYAELERRVR